MDSSRCAWRQILSKEPTGKVRKYRYRQNPSDTRWSLCNFKIYGKQSRIAAAKKGSPKIDV